MAILVPEGDSTFAVFDTERAAAEYADRSLPDHPGGRAWILWLGEDSAELVGTRGSGQWIAPTGFPASMSYPFAGGR